MPRRGEGKLSHTHMVTLSTEYIYIYIFSIYIYLPLFKALMSKQVLASLSKAKQQLTQCFGQRDVKPKRVLSRHSQASSRPRRGGGVSPVK